ncbi:MAG: hypothetical protein HY293_05725 [Planctomycetes bacterium]|nr:hypothetical protein [Planctomycetota bacterium]
MVNDLLDRAFGNALSVLLHLALLMGASLVFIEDLVAVEPVGTVGLRLQWQPGSCGLQQGPKNSEWLFVSKEKGATIPAEGSGFI